MPVSVVAIVRARSEVHGHVATSTLHPISAAQCSGAAVFPSRLTIGPRGLSDPSVDPSVLVASSTSGSTAAFRSCGGHERAEPSPLLLWFKEPGDSGAERHRAEQRRGKPDACSVQGEDSGVDFGNEEMACSANGGVHYELLTMMNMFINMLGVAHECLLAVNAIAQYVRRQILHSLSKR
eukprot:6188035-Pleurochrysis_carterae.AAC.2